MKKVFYDLRHPGADRPHQVYGLSKWANKFSPAEWSQKVAGLSIGRIGLHVGCPRVDLRVVLTSHKIGDFVWTWYGDCIVTEAVLNLFREASFTGFEPRPVVVEKIKRLSRKRREEIFIPPLWELLIKGKGGDAAPESGIRVIDQNEDGDLRYSSFRNGIIVDEANWDGSDFFSVNGYPTFILVTERVKDLIINHQLTNCALIPSHELEWQSSPRPEEWLEEKRKMANRDLASLLADLENPDTPSWLRIIHALAEKKDPGAVDSLMKKFSHPDPLIWDSAAAAVGEIGGYKNTPEPIRTEIFSKLMNALKDEDFRVRKSAAKALLYTGGADSIKVLMTLFEDPHEWVRRTAVFVIGRLNYKPALEAVKRLTRDPSKSVRETARDVVIDLSSEFC
jgi:hypothetical protein